MAVKTGQAHKGNVVAVVSRNMWSNDILSKPQQHLNIVICRNLGASDKNVNIKEKH